MEKPIEKRDNKANEIKAVAVRSAVRAGYSISPANFNFNFAPVLRLPSLGGLMCW